MALFFATLGLREVEVVWDAWNGVRCLKTGLMEFEGIWENLERRLRLPQTVQQTAERSLWDGGTVAWWSKGSCSDTLQAELRL